VGTTFNPQFNSIGVGTAASGTAGTVTTTDSTSAPHLTGSGAAYGIGFNGTAQPFLIFANNVIKAYDSGTQFNKGSDGFYCFSANPNAFTGSPDTCIARNAAGVVEVNNGTAGTFRDLVTRDQYNGFVGGAKVLRFSSTAPSISSGFGSSPSITNSNGTSAFLLTLGTGTITTGVLQLPTATAGWVCMVQDRTSIGSNANSGQTASGVTSVTVTTTSAWKPFDVLQLTCNAY